MRKPGKKIGSTLYIHKSAVHVVSDSMKKIIEKGLKWIPSDFAYEIIKVNVSGQEVSFIASNDWNTSSEPIVGNSYKVNLLKGVLSFSKGRERNPQIYHHKWMFVLDDYDGFDVETSKKRSEEWENSGLVFERKKIGNFDYWNEHVLRFLNPSNLVIEPSLSWMEQIPNPTSNRWKRGVTKREAIQKYPILYNGTSEESSKEYKPHPTQISKTTHTYQKIYEALKKEAFDGFILDASSGKGLGTWLGRSVYGFSIEDVEPFPPAEASPIYRDYKDIQHTYDFIISHMVLNVICQDERDEVLRFIGEHLNEKGRALIVVRDKKEIENQKSKKPFFPIGVKDQNSEYFFPTKRSFQKGFTHDELFAYVEDTLKHEKWHFVLEPLAAFSSDLKGRVGLMMTKVGKD